MIASGDPDARSFSYSRALAPPLWAFTAIMAIELVVVHLLVSIWSRTVAYILSLLSLGMIVALVALIRSFARLPLLVFEDGLVMRLGWMREICIPSEQIAHVATDWPSGTLKRRGVVNLAMINYPNVMIDLAPPITEPWTRTVTAVAHCVDDQPGFVAAVTAMATRHG